MAKLPRLADRQTRKLINNTTRLALLKPAAEALNPRATRSFKLIRAISQLVVLQEPTSHLLNYDKLPS